jgi:NADH-quinone oxidoreductase subunit J
MENVFYITAVVAAVSTVLAVTRLNAVHALLYLVVSLLSTAVIFFILGAPFVAALEVIVYAGAVMVLFVFVIMILNMGPHTMKKEAELLRPEVWAGPAALAGLLLCEVVFVASGPAEVLPSGMIGPREVGIALLGRYLLGVELASLLLLAALVGAYHLGRREDEQREGEEE